MVRKINAPIGAGAPTPSPRPSHLSLPVFRSGEKRQANRLSGVGAGLRSGGHVAKLPNPLQLRPLVGRLRARARQLGLLVVGIH